MLDKDGIATRDMFEKLLPGAERRKKGPYSVMECYEQIPCNPCSTSCSFKAVSMEAINSCPNIDFDKCTGCGICVGRCPGLACFILDETVGNGKVKITLPYELDPLPEKDSIVMALGRDGKIVGDAQVVKVLNGKSLDHTNIISILVDERLIYDVRSIKVK
jgi:Fe-S-cluster-containing hydrogenase component 2